MESHKYYARKTDTNVKIQIEQTNNSQDRQRQNALTEAISSSIVK